MNQHLDNGDNTPIASTSDKALLRNSDYVIDELNKLLNNETKEKEEEVEPTPKKTQRESDFQSDALTTRPRLNQHLDNKGNTPVTSDSDKAPSKNSDDKSDELNKPLNNVTNKKKGEIEPMVKSTNKEFKNENDKLEMLLRNPYRHNIVNERGVGQDKEPLTAIFNLLGTTPGSVNWCQNIKDDSNCRNVIYKHLSIVVKFLYSGTFDEKAVGQDKEHLIAILKLLGLNPGSE